MKFIRIGNNVNISWTITRYGESENLLDKDVQVYLIDKFKHRQRFEYTIKGNVIKGIYYGRHQVHTGVYRLLLIENEGTDEQVILDYIDCFTLSQKLKNTTSVGEDATSTIQTETVDISSEISTGTVEGFATKEYVDDAIESVVVGSVDLSSYAKTSDIPTKLSSFDNDSGYVDNDKLTSTIKTATTSIKSAIPSKVSQLDNDADYITSASIPTKVSQLNNDSKYITESDLEADKSNLTVLISSKVETTTFNKKVSEIEDKVSNIEIPTKVSQLNNDSGYITKHQDLSDYATKQYVDTTIDNLDLNVDVDLSPYLKKTDAAITYQTKGDYVDKEYVTTAISGKADVTSVPTKTSQLNNDSQFATESYVTEKVEAAVSSGIDLTSYAKKTDIPTAVSSLTNDADYITSSSLKEYIKEETDPIFNESPAASITATDISNWNKKTSFDGDYNSLSNKPPIPTTTGELTNNSGFITSTSLSGYAKTSDIPSNVSQFNNDAAYTTETYVKQAIADAATGAVDLTDYATKEYVTTSINDIDLSSYAKTSDIPTKTSQLNNDSSFLTEHQDISGKQDKLTDTQLSNLNADHSLYLTEHQDLSNYATTTYVDSAIGSITWIGTESEYNALTSIDDNVIYMIKVEG